MKPTLIYPAGNTKANACAAQRLKQAGLSLVDHPTPEVTHLLLDVPSKGDVEALLRMLPPDVIVAGGNLSLPGHRTVDFLKDEEYLAKNAAITADCALMVARPLLRTTFQDTPVLIIGWGRIGKCLGQMLKSLGCPVTVAARKETDRAMLQVLGYTAVDTGRVDAGGYGLIFNTVPEPMLDGSSCTGVLIDLASRPGITGGSIVWARGLPGIHAPESSGRLIAETFLRLNKEEKP